MKSIVKFHGDSLIAMRDVDGVALVAIRPICEAIGLNPDNATNNIKKHPILQN